MLRWLAKQANWAAPLAARKGQKLQSRVDFIQACSLLELYESCREGETGPEAVDDKWQACLTKWEKEQSIAVLTGYANDGMIAQITEQFAHLHDLDSGAVPIPAVLPSLADVAPETAAEHASIGPSTLTSPLPSAEFALRALASDDQQEASRDSRDALMRRLGFCPWIGPSQAPLGGDRAGLFLKGAALPGTVVALYPGQTFTIDMRMRGSDVGHWMDPRVRRQVIPRHDGAMLDVGRFQPARPNPLAVAQHARHPPLDVRPNCVRMQVDFVLDAQNSTRLLGFPAHLGPYIPVEWGAQVSQAQALHNALEPADYRAGIALLTTREVFDEELFVDHRLNPYRPQPRGYVPHDIGAAERTWGRWVDASKASLGRRAWEEAVGQRLALPAGAGVDEPPRGVALQDAPHIPPLVRGGAPGDDS